jgi:glycerate 2-kinase
MRIVIAPDKFKGTLGAAEVAAALSAGLVQARPDLDVRACPVADGGEGTLVAALSNGWRRLDVPATGPLGHRLTAPIAIGELDGASAALVEMALASGLGVLPTGDHGGLLRDALRATSLGTGELITAALDAGCETVVLGIGGSACTDGGAGLLTALGARFLDRGGAPIPLGGGGLGRLASVQLDGLDPRITQARFIVACDVDNPLTGPRGAAAVFSPQKGAGAADVAVLDANLERLVRALAGALGAAATQGAERPGAGAAGGVGYAAMTVLGAEPRPGIEVVLELVALSDQLAGADLVITGEGSLDQQSLGGKTPIGVARTAAGHGVPAIAVCGQSTLEPDEVRAAGFTAVFALADRDPVRCFSDPAGMLRELGVDLADRLDAFVR